MKNDYIYRMYYTLHVTTALTLHGRTILTCPYVHSKILAAENYCSPSWRSGPPKKSLIKTRKKHIPYFCYIQNVFFLLSFILVKSQQFSLLSPKKVIQMKQPGKLPQLTAQISSLWCGVPSRHRFTMGLSSQQVVGNHCCAHFSCP